jgi:putative monooxygenase
MAEKAHVLKPNEMKKIERGSGLRSTPLATPVIGAQHITTGITEFQHGTAIPLHYHNCEEQITILEGNAVAEINGTFHELSAPDTTFIPAGLPHRFLNRSGKIMKILWIYGSGHVTRTSVETGKTAPQLSASELEAIRAD